ncbi:hypothetical protein DMX11_06805 [Pseudomonas sp. LB-090624]|nr:hypothetical protein DMX11_06805 [Pseudomonas sp. LB-090624]
MYCRDFGRRRRNFRGTDWGDRGGVLGVRRPSASDPARRRRRRRARRLPGSPGDTTMVRKHYGRWISKDTKSMAEIVSKMMGFNASS